MHNAAQLHSASHQQGVRNQKEQWAVCVLACHEQIHLNPPEVMKLHRADEIVIMHS